MGKRVLSILLALCLLVGAMPLSASASQVTGSCGDNVDWVLDTATGELSIDGTGAMSAPAIDSYRVWYDYREQITTVSIGSGVTYVNNRAFDSCYYLTSINVAGDNANYSSLDGVLFNKGQTTLVKYPADKADISYEIPASVTCVAPYAFDGGTMTAKNKLRTLTLPDSMTSIGDQAFYGCFNVVTIVVPNSVTSIGDSAFAVCGSLRNVNIPEGVTTIGDFVFNQSHQLGDITIPASVLTIGEQPFYNCQIGPTSINVAEDNPNYSSKNGVLFNKDQTELIRYAPGKTDTEYVIPKEVTHIGDYAFFGSWGLTSIIIPDSVTGAIGNGVFAACRKLTTVTIPEKIERIWFGAFTGCEKLTDIYYGGSRSELLQRCQLDQNGNPVGLPKAEIHFGKVDVTYDSSGGTGEMDAAVMARESSLTLPECGFSAPERKEFKAWSIDGVEYAPGDTYTVASDTVVTAVWEDLVYYSATFVADGAEVAVVEFQEGADSLEEPDVPAKVHYDGAWEEYNLASARGNITVNAIYVLNDEHHYSDTVTQATCTTDGYTVHTCSVCGDSYIDGVVNAMGHDYRKNEGKSVAPERGKDGYDYYECSRDASHYYKVPVFAPVVTHTATFVVGEEVIGRVTFEEGSAVLEEPKLPERPNYIGHWESYDLAAAAGDITVHGLYSPIDPDQVSDMEANADTKYEGGVATITLSAVAASKTIKVTSETTAPVDVVLVLDQSGSMQENLSARDRQSKRDALVNCANEFVQSLYENALKTGADHRVAVTGFAYSAYNRGAYKNTGLLATANGKAINYAELKDSDYQAALLPINRNGEINANVISGIDSIVADGATSADLGLRMAKNVFAENPTDGERIVIFITDGTPTSWGETTSLVTQTAAEAISVANTIKNGQNAKIYCVGVHANADSDAAFTKDANGVRTDWLGNFVSYDFNRFLHAVSSNYPKAKAMSNLGNGSKDDGYYMAVTDTGNLGSIFTNILYNTVYELKSFDKVTFHYTLPAHFTLTLEQEMVMREGLRNSFGITDADILVDRKDDGTTELQFCNISTREAYDSEGTLIYQAVISFEVSANQGASGSTESGGGRVEHNGNTVTEFEAPAVEIPADRKLLVFTINGQVYQITEAELGETVTVPDSRLASWKVEPGTVVTGNYAVFEAAKVADTTYSIQWVMDRTVLEEELRFGEKITPPDAASKAPRGYEFSHWSRSIPATMPAYDLVCTAIYSPAHVHSFTEANQSGTCDEGITIVYRCACGELRTEKQEPEEHNYIAIFSDNGSSGTAVEKLVCTKCGHSKEQNISFKVSYSESRKTTVLDLNLYQSEVSVTEPEQKVEIRFYIGEDNGRTYTITRIDADGTKTTYRSKAEDGYLVFHANHFSIYVVGEADETGAPEEEITYEEAVTILDSKQDAVEPEEPDQPDPVVPSVSPSPEEPSDGPVVETDTTPDGTVTITTTWPDGKRAVAVRTPEGERKITVTVSGGEKLAEIEIPAQPGPGKKFEDVKPGSWYQEAVEQAAGYGLFQGTTETTFEPEAPLTRGMLITTLYRLSGETTYGLGTGAFPDVNEEAWFAKAADWAYALGVATGDGKGFSPNGHITREQLVTMLYRFAEVIGSGSENLTGLEFFPDHQKISDYAREAMEWAVAEGLIQGNEGRIIPQGKATRAEAAAILTRFVAYLKQ